MSFGKTTETIDCTDFTDNDQKSLAVFPRVAKPQSILLYENGEIASEKALAMTLTIHFDFTQHVVIASGAKQSSLIKICENCGPSAFHQHETLPGLSR
ncbi:MAG: hypothetical protein NG747_09710 [Candidatus Brocadia sp.]|nr:hypothetical protein [Candidatus Brocadia sp.]